MSDEQRDEHNAPKDANDLLRWAEGTQRTMNFILQQQAQFTVDLQALREVQARAEQKWERTAEGITALLAIAEMHAREMTELREAQAEAQARTDAQMKETDRRMAETDRRMAETDERLN